MSVKRALPILALLVGLALVAVPVSVSTAQSRIVTFGAPVHVSADDTQAAAEPSIRAARDGTLYIVAPTGIGGVRTQEGGQGGDLIWRSEDAGKTWTYLGSFDQAAGGGDADIAVDDAGVLWGSGLTLVNTTAAISTDKGATWKENPVGSKSTGLVDRQWIETYKDQPFAFMTTGNTNDNSILLSRLERTPGDAPANQTTVTVSGKDVYQWPGEIAVDNKNGFVFVSYNTIGKPKTHDKIIVTRSNLDLSTTKRFVVTTSKGDTFDSFTGLDADKAGNLYVVWSERRPRGPKGVLGHTNSYLSISRDHGRHWSKPRKLNRRPRTTTFPWVVAGSRGRVAVVYYGTRTLGKSPEAVVQPTKKRAPAWGVYVDYSLNALASHPRYGEARTFRPFIHQGNICTSGTGCASGTRDLLDFLQLDLDPCGHIVVTYTDNSRDVVTKAGQRTTNNPELVSFVGQTGGPTFYKAPLKSGC